MSYRYFVGIDPGKGGAIAVIDQEGENPPWIEDTPTIKVGKKTHFDVAGMSDLLRRIDPTQAIAFVEKVGAMPGQGVTSMFNFGGNYFSWQMGLSCFRVPYELVTPQRWKKSLLAGMPKGKGSSRQKAIALFPAQQEMFRRVKDDGRAEALLIAEFARRTVHPATNSVGA